MREHLEDRFFWIVLWAFVASVAFVIARSQAASTYVGNLPGTIALFASVGFLVCVLRPVVDTLRKSVPVTAIYRITGGQAAVLFLIAVLVAGLGNAVLLLIIGSSFARED